MGNDAMDVLDGAFLRPVDELAVEKDAGREVDLALEGWCVELVSEGRHLGPATRGEGGGCDQPHQPRFYSDPRSTRGLAPKRS